MDSQKEKLLEAKDVPLSLWELDRAKAVRTFLCDLVALGAVAPLESTFTLYALPMANSLGCGLPLTNIAFTILIVLYALVGPYFCQVGKNRGYEVCVGIALVAVVLASLGAATALTLPHLYVSYFFGGLGIGAVYVPCTIGAMQVMPESKQAFAAGVTTVTYLLVPSLLASPVTYMIETIGWRSAFAVQGALSVMMLCISFAAFPRLRRPGSKGMLLAADDSTAENLQEIEFGTQDNTQGTWSGMFAGISATQFTLYYLAFCAIGIVYFFAEAEIQEVLEAELPKHSIGVLIGTSMNLCTNTASRLVWGAIASSFSARVVLIGSSSLSGFCLILWSAFGDSAVLALLLSAGVTAGSASMWTLLPVLASQTFGAENAGSMYALAGTSTILSSFLGAPAVAEVASQFGWPSAKLLLSIVAALVPLSLLAMRPKK
jgi:MFS family permease